MVKRTRDATLLTRRASKAATGRVVKEKFIEENMSKVLPLKPMNAKQAQYIQMINENSLVLATGYAGTSKTYIPTVIACDLFTEGKIDKIVLTRPNISNSKSLGAFKGTLIEKLTPWLAPVLSTMKERLGLERLTLALEQGNIEFLPLEVIKGYSANNCFFLCDEAEDLDWADAKKILTRQGKNCTMVLAGDITQSELKDKSGIKKIIELVKKYPSLDVGHIDFNEIQDIVRSSQVKEWIRVFSKEGL